MQIIFLVDVFMKAPNEAFISKGFWLGNLIINSNTNTKSVIYLHFSALVLKQIIFCMCPYECIKVSIRASRQALENINPTKQTKQIKYVLNYLYYPGLVPAECWASL